MEINNRKSIWDKLDKYDILINSNDKENAYIEITEWTNGEGYDINISNKWKNQIFSLTHGELEAINYLTKHMDYNEEN